MKIFCNFICSCLVGLLVIGSCIGCKNSTPSMSQQDPAGHITDLPANTSPNAASTPTYEQLIEKARKAVSTDEKIYYFSKALEIRPDDSVALAGKGEGYMIKSLPGNDHVSNKSQLRIKGLELTDRAIALNPSCADGYVALGFGYYIQGKYEEAIDSYTKAIQLDPNNPSHYIRRASTYQLKHEYEKALADADTAIGIDPTTTQAYITKGLVFEAMKDESRANAEYEKAINSSPEKPAPYMLRGRMHEKNGRLEDAINDYSRVIERNAKDYYIYKFRAAAYLKEGMKDRADADEKMSLELNPDAHFELGMSKSFSDDAVIEYGKAIDLNPWDANYYVSRGTVWLFKREYNKALSDFNQAIDINPELPSAYKWRSVANGEKGDVKSSLADLKKACDLGTCDDYKLAIQSISYLQGKIIASDTKNPVSGALVILKRDSHIHDPFNGNTGYTFVGRQYAITDRDGRFSIPPVAPEKPILPQLGGKQINNYIEAVYHPKYAMTSGVSLETPNDVVIDVYPSTIVSDGHFQEMFIRPNKIPVRKEDFPLLANVLKSWRSKVYDKALEMKIDEFEH